MYKFQFDSVLMKQVACDRGLIGCVDCDQVTNCRERAIYLFPYLSYNKAYLINAKCVRFSRSCLKDVLPGPLVTSYHLYALICICVVWWLFLVCCILLGH